MKRACWLAAVAVLAIPGSRAVGAMLDVKAGEKERWSFVMAGRPVGSMSAECRAVRKTAAGAEADSTYNLKLNLPAQGSEIRLSMKGAFTLSRTGTPVGLSIDADAAGQRQNVKVRFASGKATLTGTVGGQAIRKSAAVTGKEFLSVNNLMTLLSLATRVLRPAPGNSVTAPFFAIEMMQSVDLTFAARSKTETLRVGGRNLECVVCDVAPIAAKIHVVRATGEMVRYAMDAQQLVIERQ